jgi:hypothetical protein
MIAIEVNVYPFCGAIVNEHPNAVTGKEFFIVYHNPGCHFLTGNPSNHTLLSKSRHVINSWNNRTSTKKQ